MRLASKIKDNTYKHPSHLDILQRFKTTKGGKRAPKAAA